jgi:hypothetical protein
MCTTCDEIGRVVRWSISSLSDVIRQIGGFVSQGKLVEIGEAAPQGPFLVVRYRCAECAEVWRLTYPDQGMIGGFAREQ